MPILNKDGSVYKLRGPNPLLKEQNHWDMNKIVLHNFDQMGRKSDQLIPCNTEVLQPNPRQEFVPDPIPVSSNPPEPVRADAIPIVEPRHEPVRPDAIPTTEPRHEPEPEFQKGLIRVHCLPAILKHHQDEPYGEQQYVTISYGRKFEFDANFIDKTDLLLVLWTARKSVTEGSILFPKTGHVRWWRVSRAVEEGVGLTLYCGPSDEQPSFN